MSGFKDFTDGSVLTAGELDGYLMRQGVMRFATTALLTGALVAGIAEKGMLAWADSTNTLYQYDGASAWIPVWSTIKTWNTTWSGSGTPPSIGNGSIAGAWKFVDGLVHGYCKITLGTSTNAGTGSNYTFSLPVDTDAAIANASAIGEGIAYDNSVNLLLPRTVITVGSASAVAMANDAGSRVSSTTVAWASTDVISLAVRYRPDNSLNL